MSPEDKKEYMKNWREANKEKIKNSYSNWVVDNREKRNISNKIYREKNFEKLNENHKTYRKNNQEKIKTYKKDYDLKNRHLCAWRSVLKCNLRRIGKKKEGTTLELLGYSALELKIHLEKLFTEGMSWDNYGEWHVDHKIPMNSFQFNSTDDIEFKECWKLSNLQPLWGPDNLSKGTKLL